MDWLRDKKNQPIVAGALAVIILGALVAMYFLYFAGEGSPDTSSTPPPMQDASAGMPSGMPPSAPPGASPATPPTPQAAQPGGRPAAAESATTPMEAFRPDPFLPVGYKPLVRRVKPRPPIRDLPIQNWSQWVTEEKKRPEPDLPQPVRRMAGLIVSDSIYAIIETNGKSEIRQPGDMLDDRMARVERIERDRVVLKTMDKKPKYLIVRMASAPRTETPGSSGASAPSTRGSRYIPGGPPGGDSPM